MPKHGNKSLPRGEKLAGPLYTSPGDSLGAAEVAGPKGGKPVPDPLGYLQKGK